MSGVTRARDFHVFDADREHLGSFQTFHAAHDWAHLQAALGGVTTPVEVEDRTRRITRQITRETCETFVWRGSPVVGATAPTAPGTVEPGPASRPGGERAPDSPPGPADASSGGAAAACGAAVGADLATTLQGAADRSPDAYRSGRRTPQPRPPLDAEITGGRRPL